MVKDKVSTMGVRVDSIRLLSGRLDNNIYLPSALLRHVQWQLSWGGKNKVGREVET